MWRKIWAPHPADDQRRMHFELARHTISSALFLENLFGNYGCGMVALEAYFTDNPEVTPDYVDARLNGYHSVDTVRRRMTEMVKAGTLLTRRQGRTIYYRLNPEIADTAINFLKGEPTVIPATETAVA